MARDNKINLPSSGAGLTRYFDEYKSKIELKPSVIIVLVIVIIIIEIFLHTQGLKLLGIV
ncbi:preprotein translocase subunit Sec61beta [Candidatus Woesearchaeota archaeon]|nr:preprotein translocase subunit Sec61beta [Candidatus Woesearchaeota archaeon]